MNGVKLDTILVGDIKGDFVIPSFQRGYRWEEEVTRLLDDIYNNASAYAVGGRYCLQPIVVRRDGESYIVVDGQQRLTTLFLLYQCLHKASRGFLRGPQFTIRYETRAKSEQFLNAIDFALAEDNIDFWFMANAYRRIEEWFHQKGDKPVVLTNMDKYLAESVAVIWYEVGAEEDIRKLFIRLNIGKIPLTNAELVKAMFLSRDANDNITSARQEEISLRWDTIERDLHDDPFWCFLANRTEDRVQTRIDLILDLIAQKPQNSRETYYTFFAFTQMGETRKLGEIWEEISHTYLILKDWYEDDALYHRIGYLIAVEAKQLSEIYGLSLAVTKSEFSARLDAEIKKSLKFNKAYRDLDYESDYDRNAMQKILLLFNIMSLDKQEGARFPFDRYKTLKKGARWSLEHIHAQHSEGMKTETEWREWLTAHREAIAAVSDRDASILDEIDRVLGQTRISGTRFAELQEKIFARLSAGGEMNLDGIGNLALLDTGNNAALSNSVFAVKRNHIIEMDKNGEFIPPCTKKVFLKYYSMSAETQLHFWGKTDADAYLKEMDRVLRPYLSGALYTEADEGED